MMRFLFNLAILPIMGMLGTTASLADHPASLAIKTRPAPERAIERQADDDTDPVPDDAPPPGTTPATTITGRLFYNDRRDEGHFDKRKRPDGLPGTRCGRTSVFCGPNFLGAKYMTVEAFEIDPPETAGTDCRNAARLGSAVVRADGEYRLHFVHRDRCGDDRPGTISIEVRFLSRYCMPLMCFSIAPEGSATSYSIRHPNATRTQPKSVVAGRNVRLSDAAFNAVGDVNTPADTSIAANYFAAIVDAMVFLHEDNAIPFFRAEYGELTYRYPSTRSSTATALSPTEVAISHYGGNSATVMTPGGGTQTIRAWPDAKTAAHEYGHILMQRAWDGSYGLPLVGKSAGDNERASAPGNPRAFKEAWAEFVSNAVFPVHHGCNRIEINDPADFQRYLDNRAAIESATGPHFQSPSGNIFGPPLTGAAYRWNVRKALCDWYDTANDDDPRLTGPGDQFQDPDIYSMWVNLRGMYLDRARYGGRFTEAGFAMCDWLNHYTVVRLRSPEFDGRDRAQIARNVANLMANNNVACRPPVANPSR